MKKILLLLCVLTVLPASAQWRYGLRIGGEFTAPLYDHNAVGAYLPAGGCGFTGGLGVEWQMPTSGLAVGGTLMYQRRTVNINSDIDLATGQPANIHRKMGGDFLALPIDIKYKFWLSKFKNLAAPYIFTGPDIAIRLNKGDDSQRTHFGWNFGIGFDIVNFIQISGGYRLGINDITPEGKGLSVRDSGGFVSATLLFDF